MKFDKFLENQPEPEEPKPQGRSRKPAHLKHPRSKNLDQCDAQGRVLPEFRKHKKIAGRRHYAVKRAVLKARRKRLYARNRLKQKALRDGLKRKFVQHRSYHRLKAKRRGLDPDQYYKLTYAEYLLIWHQAPQVFIPDRGLVPARELIDNPVKHLFNCTYLDRRDTGLPFTRDNTKVFYRGKELV